MLFNIVNALLGSLGSIPCLAFVNNREYKLLTPLQHGYGYERKLNNLRCSSKASSVRMHQLAR